MIGCRAWLSWVLAAETPTSSGRPFASDSTCSLEPLWQLLDPPTPIRRPEPGTKIADPETVAAVA